VSGKTGVLAGNLKNPSQLVGTTVPHDKQLEETS